MTDLILTDDEIASLNEARDILRAFAEKCQAASWNAPMRIEFDEDGTTKALATDYAAVRALATVADDQIFNVLNWTCSHYVRRITDDVLHNRKAEQAA